VEFRFDVIRIWEVPVETLLTAGLGVAPLAPLGRLPEGATPQEALPAVVQRLEERLVAEAPDDAETLLTAAFILTGLRLDKGQQRQLFQGVRAMRESSGYQIILDEGRAEGEVRGVRATILRQGRKRFGPPDSAVESALQAIMDLERLERMSERVLDAAGWQDLAATP
jgi:predicted transposase YdaD